MQLPPPILIEGVPHLCYADLLQAVAIALFPANGIQTQTEYEQAISLANKLADSYHFHIRCELHPPIVPFGQQGSYLKQVKFEPEKRLTNADTKAGFDKQGAGELTNLTHPFSVLGQAAKTPPAFFPMLASSLSIPLQPQWADHLWQAGQQHDLITLTDPITAGVQLYTVSPDIDEWQLIVQIGFNMGLLKIHAVQSQRIALTAIGLPWSVTKQQAATTQRDCVTQAGIAAGWHNVAPLHNKPTDNRMMTAILKHTLFPLGRLHYSPEIALAVQTRCFNPLPLLKRHSQQDWGDIPFEAGCANSQVFKAGEPLFSMYTSEIGQLYIITEHDYSRTLIITSAEY